MFCSRQSNNLINKVHTMGLRLTCRDETKDFQQILKEQNEIIIHQRNFQVLMTEVYKTVNGIAPQIMNSLFQFRCSTNNIRNFQEIFTENRKLSNMVRKQWRIEHRSSGQIYTLNIKTLRPLMSLKEKLLLMFSEGVAKVNFLIIS